MVCAATGAHRTEGAPPPEEVVGVLLDSLESFSAKFEQKRYDEYGELIDVAHGRCFIKRPGRFLWSYSKPYVQLIVSDGSSLWVHDEDLEQVTVNTLSEVNNVSPAGLLGANKPIGEHYQISQRDTRGGYDWYRLSPKAPNPEFQWVEIGIADGEIKIMHIVDTLRQLIVLNFSSVETNMPINDGFFNFNPPPGVDVIQGTFP